MRRAANIDATQPEIVAALKSLGASVQSLAAVGKGVPDLLIGFRGANYLVECKTIRKGRRKAVHQPSQGIWHANWRGQVVVLHSADEAVRWLSRAESARQSSGEMFGGGE